ncbi:MAG TPA: ABC transporter ATP-binding protein [Acidimicrobiales bacterium]|jgi:branched-chain amino acid transport system ATP-binding protein|nr:ABC transporter ATP-binding protein [Acidimicrobiales bacterium]
MPAALELDGVVAGYGRVEILHGVSLAVPEGAVVALLGPNGAGKTTTLRVISGTVTPTKGAIRLDGRRIRGRAPSAIARLGVALIPEGRGIFPSLSVKDNIEIAVRSARPASASGRRAGYNRIVETFPRLGERLGQAAGTLSGGEQQMLALGRALVAEPRVLMMDEISMGLAPIVVDQLFTAVAGLRAEGTTILLVEQYLTYALQLADICYVMAKGEVAFAGEPHELRDPAVVSRYLGAGA